MDTNEEIETLFKVELPLEELKEGFGYSGVLLRNKEQDTLQCHICGTWHKGLSSHIKKHKMNTETYKVKFGLPLTFPLVSRSTSAKHRKRALGLNSIKNCIKKRNGKLASDSCARWKRNYHRNSAAFRNINGTCAKQIEERFIVLCDREGRTVSYGDIQYLDKALHSAIKRRFKTFNNFKSTMGLSTIEKPKIQTKVSLINALRSFFLKKHRVPKWRDFRKGNPCAATFVNHFGSWSKALAMAGIK